jgi:maleamate amidohydrolase
MDRHPWADVISDVDRAVIERGGYGKPRGLGTRPALLLIDCQYNHIGADQPILDQIGDWPAGGGSSAWAAAWAIQPLLHTARATGVPVIFTRYCYTEQTARFDAFAGKRGRNLAAFMDGSPGTRIITELQPVEGELVVDKVNASAFYATALLSALVSLGVDTIFIAGVSTSGCVRATAVDAASNNFKVAVVSDGTADRIELSHKISLLDLWMKYADVLTSADVNEYLESRTGGVS